MARRYSVFYSFHFDNDVFRVQQIRNIGALDGNEPVSANDWEAVKKKGDPAVERWIDENMKYKNCVIVLVGAATANRPWVKYEIKKAWNDKRPIFGIYIHNIKCPRTGLGQKGSNPFRQFNVGSRNLGDLVSCYDPSATDAYADISKNIESWIDKAIASRT